MFFFLPANPVILQAGAHYGTETLNFAKHWPESKIFSFGPNPQNGLKPIDFLCLNLQGSELQILKSSPQILQNVNCIAVHTFSFSFHQELKNFLESCGFQLLSHWYREGLEGDAIIED